jgi:hypothetical protein
MCCRLDMHVYMGIDFALCVGSIEPRCYFRCGLLDAATAMSMYGSSLMPVDVQYSACCLYVPDGATTL